MPERPNFSKLPPLVLQPASVLNLFIIYLFNMAEFAMSEPLKHNSRTKLPP